MGNKSYLPSAAPVTEFYAPEVWGDYIDPETEEPIKKMTLKWGEFTVSWDDATERVLSGFYMRWVTGGDGWNWPSGTWV